MTDIEALLHEHDIKVACAADRANKKSNIFIDTGRDSEGDSPPSLERLKRKIEKCIVGDKKQIFATIKLYIVGSWNYAELEGEVKEEERLLARAQEWKDGVEMIRKLIAAMGCLKELVWTSELPFMSDVFKELPRLTKLVLDLNNPVDIMNDGFTLAELYIRAEDMEPLLNQTKLKELRLLRLRDSLQFIAWQTVFLNEAEGGMRILELQMHQAPIVRRDDWRKAVDVHNLTVAHAGLLEKEYKGLNGTGNLHWEVGYGEYLDNFCIRRARIISDLPHSKPLPLLCLRLDGFVIDHLPFEHELVHIMLLVCGEKCVDAGLRAPKTRSQPDNDWNKRKANGTCNCVIQWPNWTGVFDPEGEQRDTHDVVVSQEVGLATPYAEIPPSLPLTEEALSLKSVGDALKNVSQGDYFKVRPALQTLPVPDTHLGKVSNISERGSTTSTIEIPAIDGSQTFDAVSPTDSALSSNILHTNGASFSSSELPSPSVTNRTDSFGSDGPIKGHKARKSLTEEYWILGPS